MKKITTIMLSLLMVGVIVNPVNAAFPDVSSEYIYSDAINYVQEEGIVDGFTDGEFKPERTITRAEFAKIIVNSKYASTDHINCVDNNYHNGEDVGSIDGVNTHFYSDIFNDVPGGTVTTYFNPSNGSIIKYDFGNRHEFARYICYAKEEGLLQGYPDGTFQPESPITVGEASKIISNAYGFTDLDSGPEGDVFKPFVDVLGEKHAIPTSIVSIGSELKRGEMAEIIYRLEEKIEDKASTDYDQLLEHRFASKLGLFYDSDIWEYLDNSEGNYLYSKLLYMNENHEVFSSEIVDLQTKLPDRDHNFQDYYCAFTDSEWDSYNETLLSQENVLDLRNFDINTNGGDDKKVIFTEKHNIKKTVKDEAQKFYYYSYELPGKTQWSSSFSFENVSFQYEARNTINYIVCEKSPNADRYKVRYAALGFGEDSSLEIREAIMELLGQ